MQPEEPRISRVREDDEGIAYDQGLEERLPGWQRNDVLSDKVKYEYCETCGTISEGKRV